jgi:formylglycine-generating enzyme required for sulfatase activity
MLPTEAQWQYAAQGDDGRAYPWGNEWDAGRCNNNVDGKGIGRTTPVRQYEGKGDSPFGVVDMAGNVDEWCLTLSETGRDDLYGTDRRVLRGGSYGPTHAANFRCAFRSWFYPNGTNVGWGIRLALTPSAQVIGHDSAQIVTHTVAAMPKPAPPPPPPARLSSSMVPALLPAPFAWVEIPGGRGTMATYKSDVTLSIPSQTYWMAKYPVTNVQYAVFIEAGGYTTERWWTAEGWQKRKAEKWTQPRYWTDSNWNGAEQPVVGVSWYEAVAFCRWLSETTGEKIMLPTEAQWQYAAQGDDGRAYPWGNPWDAGRCNNNVDGKGLVPHHYDIYG